jgi:enediyne biosynthesis protein E4
MSPGRLQTVIGLACGLVFSCRDEVRRDVGSGADAAADILTFDTGTARALFRNIAGEIGLASYVADTGEDAGDEKHGPGGVFTDLDLDGYPELLLLTARGQSSWLLHNQPDGHGGRTLVRLPFDEATSPGSTGAVAADYDNDGDVDLFVTNYGEPNQLYRNRLIESGLLSFEDVTAPAGLGALVFEGRPLIHAMTAAWSDVDRDGWLDLYVGNHHGSSESGPQIELPGERDILYHNMHDGTFVDITLLAGTPGWSQPDGRVADERQRYASTNAVLFADLDRDGWDELVVTNKTGTPADRTMFYRNRGMDTQGVWLGFENISERIAAGKSTPLAMGIDAGDVDGDGDLDLYVTDWAPRDATVGPNKLWLNQFQETGILDFTVSYALPGVSSWGTKFLDYDNDGRLDVHVASGGLQAAMLYRNTRQGFVEVAHEVGVAYGLDARGDMTGDFNRDGRLDLLMVALGRPSRLYLNPGFSNAHHLSVTLVGDPALAGRLRSSVDAIGAVVIVVADVDQDGVVDEQIRQIRSGDSNAASTSSLVAHFGLGRADKAEVRVHWPSGRRSVLSAVVDTFITVAETP